MTKKETALTKDIYFKIVITSTWCNLKPGWLEGRKTIEDKLKEKTEVTEIIAYSGEHREGHV